MFCLLMDALKQIALAKSLLYVSRTSLSILMPISARFPPQSILASSSLPSSTVGRQEMLVSDVVLPLLNCMINLCGFHWKGPQGGGAGHENLVTTKRNAARVDTIVLGISDVRMQASPSYLILCTRHFS